MFGAKLSWCQIVRCQIVLVPNCPGAKLSAFIILVPNCPLLLSWCQIVWCHIVRCQIVLQSIFHHPDNREIYCRYVLVGVADVCVDNGDNIWSSIFIAWQQFSSCGNNQHLSPGGHSPVSPVQYSGRSQSPAACLRVFHFIPTCQKFDACHCAVFNSQALREKDYS